MPNHQASEQMLGYLYQVRYALALLLENDNSDCQISIEKFDDVAFSKDDIPIQLIQLKHHIQHQGNLADASTDMWRTIKVWLDAISETPDILDGTNFLIITTATAPIDSAAFLLKKDSNRNPDTAYQKLKTVCFSSVNQAHQRYYDAFREAGEDTVKQLIRQIYIIDCASNIIDVEKDILKHIRYSCIPKHQKMIYERLEGWWFKKAIDALCCDTPVFVNQNQVRSFIVSVSQEYADDNLPIDILDIDDLQESNFSANEKIFHEQLKLICLGNHRMQLALRDYYRAFRQRASWVRNDLLYVNELGQYEQRLIDEWEHAFAAMEETLSETNNATEEEKAKEGRQLFSDIEKKDIRIRPKCQEAFIMRGSYHILANQLKIGWHVDFFDRLKQLLNT
ncbi:ABC-three component system protein [Ruminococcus sp.]|uniref:ABC-three component system protein n=1 Tax=Ruminococcus sp. TaxID=41978 RepID=UPI003AB76F24